MESLYLLIPLSVLLAFLIGAVFWWCVRSGQFEDLEGPAYRILQDDDAPHKEAQNSAETQKTPDSPADER
ncbi:cbb3-type cytochrome oxidase assembly protein CcoS [Andreprevotia chitinilytica]|uniref:cbb3-type cytochrome oxidase assembly protein CcoS n=1 Tax=Andreprevotia chitinilytica TaxID=396808 RepID=UPI00054F2822|nr:cbb3-type cytochrome oxidase assembly protein CcoS [Andreprevotia chitinilytica]